MRKHHTNSKITVRQADGTSEVVSPMAFQKHRSGSFYAEYRRSRHWREIRKKALRRDGHRCTICKGTVKLEVHHLTYARIWRERLEDLVTLCQRCHAAEHSWQRRAAS